MEKVETRKSCLVVWHSGICILLPSYIILILNFCIRQCADNFVSRIYYNQNLFRFESNQKYKHCSVKKITVLYYSRLHFSKFFLHSLIWFHFVLQVANFSHQEMVTQKFNTGTARNVFDCCGTTEVPSFFLSNFYLVFFFCVCIIKSEVE